MICLLHGDNHLTSRKKLTDLVDGAKIEHKEIIRLEGKTASLTAIKQALESQSLFGQDKMIVLDSLFSRQKSNEKDKILDYLKTTDFSADLVLWEPKKIDGRSLKGFSQSWQILFYKTPAVIFNFLDSIKPENQRQMLTLLQRCIREDSPEMVFYMLASRIRQLVVASDLGKKALTGSPWQIGKLVKQAKSFSLEQLVKLYKELLQIDIGIKTGRSLMPLGWHLDLLVSSL